MLKRTLWSLCFLALLSALPPARVEAAAVISVGPYTVPTTNDPFLVPIQITGGVDVIAWSFGLTYDPADLLINDPAFFDFLGRPVTDGDFFAAGAPFNLLVPGVIALDGFLNQTGNLFGVEGAYGGFPPYPSGAGILAYVEFIRAPDGIGDTRITVTDPSTTSAVPEPTTLALLALGLLALGARRKTALAWRIAT